MDSWATEEYFYFGLFGGTLAIPTFSVEGGFFFIRVGSNYEYHPGLFHPGNPGLQIRKNLYPFFLLR